MSTMYAPCNTTSTPSSSVMHIILFVYLGIKSIHARIVFIWIALCAVLPYSKARATFVCHAYARLILSHSHCINISYGYNKETCRFTEEKKTYNSDVKRRRSTHTTHGDCRRKAKKKERREKKNSTVATYCLGGIMHQRFMLLGYYLFSSLRYTVPYLLSFSSSSFGSAFNTEITYFLVCTAVAATAACSVLTHTKTYQKLYIYISRRFSIPRRVTGV